MAQNTVESLKIGSFLYRPMLNEIEKVEITGISKSKDVYTIKWGEYASEKQSYLTGKEKTFIGDYKYEWYLNIQDAKAKQLLIIEEHINYLQKEMIKASESYHSAIKKYTTIINKNI